MRSSKHIAALDGVRGLAILLVIADHVGRLVPTSGVADQAAKDIATSGWVGVDLFFVLSGFLITGILLDAKGGARYFRSFYARRVLRIFPLYFAFVAAALWIAPALGWNGPNQGPLLHERQGWFWTYMVNVLVARHGWAGAPPDTGHLWSLAVEEQFYLAWPLVVALSSRRALARIAIGAIVTASLLRVALVAAGVPGAAIYVLLPTRMDCLAAGALLAIAARDETRWPVARRALAAAAPFAALVLAGVFAARHALEAERAPMQVAGYPAVVLLAALAIATAVGPRLGDSVRSFWRWRPLRFFGRYSYAMYVLHPPIITLLVAAGLGPQQIPLVRGTALARQLGFGALALAVTTAAALASWHLLEQPFLRLKRFVPYGR
ncbi:MAG TPA: acyltransferase [Gemmatimonadaceae bacterium]